MRSLGLRCAATTLLAGALRFHEGVTQLDISHNPGIRGEGVRALAEGLLKKATACKLAYLIADEFAVGRGAL